MFGLIPKDEKYFTLLHNMALKVKESGDLFMKIFQDYEKRAGYSEQIKTVEVACDEIAAHITQKLNSSFITPLDREDIFLLVKELDDVVDLINDLARRLDIYDVPVLKPYVAEIANLIGKSTGEIAEAFRLFEKHEGMKEHLEALTQLERRGDVLYNEGLRTLFREEKDPIALIKWMSIYEELENCLDRCKDVAEALEGVVVKNK
jgi:predicted phosphate transport protein (TIGR00153 family)